MKLNRINKFFLCVVSVVAIFTLVSCASTNTIVIPAPQIPTDSTIEAWRSIDVPKNELNAPVTTLKGTVVKWNSVSKATSYMILYDGKKLDEIEGTELNLLDYDFITEGEHEIQVVAKASGYLYGNSNTVIFDLGALPQLSTPALTLSGDTLSWGKIDDATSYEIYSGTTLLDTVTTLSVNLASAIKNYGTFELSVVAKGAGYRDSDFSTTISYVKTDIGDLSVREYTGSNGVVAAASAYAAEAGLRVLKQGGNAFDAAVAVGFALGVVEPNASGIGGGGIMVAWDNEHGEFVGYNYREFVAAKTTSSNFKAGISSYQNLDKEAVKTGAGNLSVSGVPTLVAALCKIHETHTNGVTSLEDCLAPAIQYADEGFPVPKELASQFSDNWNVLSSYNEEYAWRVFSLDGFDPGIPEGELLIQKDYANTLRLIAEDSKIEGHNGAAGFYTGPTAEAMLKSNGYGVKGNYGTIGLFSQADFDYAMEHYPERMTTKQNGLLETTYHGYNICTAGVPSSGGVIMIEALNCLQSKFATSADLTSLGHNSAEYINAVQTALFLGYSDKKKYMADLIHDNTARNYYVTVMTHPDYAASRYAQYYKPGKAPSYSSTSGLPGSDLPGWATKLGISKTYDDTALEMYVDSGNDEHYSTTSYSVADKWGNIVSVTQTLNHFFGTGVMPEGTGFYMNNNLTSMSTSSSSVNYVKVHKNPVSHIMPTIVTDSQNNPVLTLGSPGSFRIPAAVTNTLINVLDFGYGMQEAISASRVFIYPDDDHTDWGLEVEICNDITDQVVSELKAMGWGVNSPTQYYNINLYFGGVQGIRFNSDGTMTGGADPRRDGKALGY